MENEEYFRILRERVEEAAGFSMKTPKDFDLLVTLIYNSTHVLLNNYTLKRFWGYLKSTEVRTTTLNTLCQFCGYTSMEAFKESLLNNEIPESGPNNSLLLNSKDLMPGDTLQLIWNPGRKVTVRYEGMDLFVVTQSVKSKLQAGDMFHCQQFVNGQPLVLSCLVRPGMAPCNYVCGEKEGIRFEKG